jgi:hypothetical protein
LLLICSLKKSKHPEDTSRQVARSRNAKNVQLVVQLTKERGIPLGIQPRNQFVAVW